MAPKPIASALQAVDEDEERSDSFPITWILAIIFNGLFIICLFVALIYCIKRRKQSTCLTTGLPFNTSERGALCLVLIIVFDKYCLHCVHS